MSRTCKTVDYNQALDLTVRLGDCLPPDHLARFVVDSVAQLDLSALVELAPVWLCHRGVQLA
jgi:hypothetical protein